MGQGLELLATRRLTAMVAELQAQTDIPQDLIWLSRAASRDATDGEILGHWRGDVVISDIIMEDSVAVTKNGDRYTTETYTIPKIKHGVRINEEMINLLVRLESNSGLNFERLTVRGYVAQKLADIVLGIRQRENAILAAMHLDDFDYNLGGVVLQNVSWGMPADLKFTPTVQWTLANAATMTAISDITTATRYGLQMYGARYNRITLSIALLDAIFNSTEFKQKAQLYSMLAFPGNSFPLINELGPQVAILESILAVGDQRFKIVTEDSRYKDQKNDGSINKLPYWPTNKVLIDNTANDNNVSSYFLGKAIVPETVVASIVQTGGMQGTFGGPQRGPVAWSESLSLNPPNINLWGADKAWPVRIGMQDELLLTVA